MTQVVPFKADSPATEVLTIEERERRISEIRSEITHIQQVALLEIGSRLAEARDLYRYDRAEGGFRGFVESVGFSTSFAYDAIAVYERLGKENVSAARTLSQTLPQKALVALARSTPEIVVKEVIALAVSGETVTAQDIARMRQEEAEKVSTAERERKKAEREKEAALEQKRAAEQEAEQAKSEAARLKATAIETAKKTLDERLKKQVEELTEKLERQKQEASDALDEVSEELDLRIELHQGAVRGRR